MTCPDCGYMMGGLDKSCLRCASNDKSGKNPYVAFQNTRNPPAEQYAVPTLKAQDRYLQEAHDCYRQEWGKRL